jgi:hypothetical protein
MIAGNVYNKSNCYSVWKSTFSQGKVLYLLSYDSFFVFWYVVANVSVECTLSIFGLDAYPNDEGNTLLQSVGKHLSHLDGHITSLSGFVYTRALVLLTLITKFKIHTLSNAN